MFNPRPKFGMHNPTILSTAMLNDGGGDEVGNYLLESKLPPTRPAGPRRCPHKSKEVYAQERAQLGVESSVSSAPYIPFIPVL